MTANEPAGKDGTLEAILRQLVALRSGTVMDDQLLQLIRLVDSATWSAPVPMTLLVDGALLRGSLVPGEVNAAYLDEALERSAHAAVSQLESSAASWAPEGEDGEAGGSGNELIIRQARAFAKRMRRRPFSNLQARIRQRNANALVAISNWHQSSEHDTRLTPLEISGEYTDPASPARAVIPYMTGQRALTLTDVKMLAGGEWLAIPAPVRVVIARIGAWAIDQ
ncbi:MAG TPA: hypothetical protein VF070_16100 [Streptosporangiaceae bacterium]